MRRALPGLGKNCYISGMGTSQLLASGAGWCVRDIVCTAGPHDRSYEEHHGDACIAVVTQGTFQYRSAHGAAVLVPGSVLLGNKGACFECGHEHAAGDRCLSFHFTPAFLENAVKETPGARTTHFAVPRLPPMAPLASLIAAAEAARDEGDAAELEELGLRLVGAVTATLAPKRMPRAPSRSDERRITAALRRIECEAHAPIALVDLAREAAMSPYHFLRTFREVAGMTPHQFVLHTRLHRAAVLLRRSEEPISAIAFDAGFGDLSTFNRRFRRVMRSSPGVYRARGRGLHSAACA